MRKKFLGMGYRFKTAVLGGTFDHFHKGHKELIEHGLSIAERLIIGITSDRYVSNSKFKNSSFAKASKNRQNSKFFEDFQKRKKEVEDYLNQVAPGRFEIAEIDDLFGPTLDKSFSADVIVVSKDSKNGALIINEKRARNGLNQLYIEVCSDIFVEDKKLISSMQIRGGEIDRDGRLYINPKWLLSDLEITDEIRRELKVPFGKLSEKIDLDNLKNSQGFVIAVGDETSKVLNSLSIPTQISIIDFKIAREKRFTNVKELGFSGSEEIIKVTSPAGVISKELFSTIITLFKNSSKKRQIILIEGEDDLSVMPLILASPLGNHIFYGQPGEGIVEIQVNEENKAKIRQIVSKFNTRGY